MAKPFLFIENYILHRIEEIPLSSTIKDEIVESK